MNLYKITYKRTAAALDLPATVEAERYLTRGRFFEFCNGAGFDTEVVAAVSSDLVAYISVGEGADS